MKKTILKTFFIIFTIVSLVGCGAMKKYQKTPNWYEDASNSGVTVTVYNIPVTPHQLDSICIADTLSLNLADWNRSFYINYETKDTVFKYVFIKNKTEIYIISEYKDSLSIHKQIRKKK